MKVLTPILLALLGLGAGVGAGRGAEAGARAGGRRHRLRGAGGRAGRARRSDAGTPAEAAPCTPAEPDPFEPVASVEKKPAGELAYVTMDKPFVVPVFAGEKVIAWWSCRSRSRPTPKRRRTVEA